MTGRKEKAVAALIRAPTQATAAKEAGVGVSTLRRWLREDEEFQTAYQVALSGLIDDAATQAKRALSPALSTLREIVEDSEQPASARIQASRSLLEYGLRLTEINDILRKLEGIDG